MLANCRTLLGRTRLWAALLGAGLLCGDAPAQQQQRVLEPGQLLTDGSRVYVRVGKTGLGHEHAIIGGIKSGNLNLAEAGGGRIVFDMTSFAADTPEARKILGLEGTTDDNTQRQVTANMQSKAVLDVKQFPTAEFVVTAVRKLDKPNEKGQAQFQLSGEFTLHGVTRPLQLIAAAEQKEGWIHVTGGFTCLQTQFGITPYKVALGAVGVADRLDIYGDLWIAAERKTLQR